MQADERALAPSIHHIGDEECDMAFGNFWRGRERFGGDRNRDRWRTGGPWRDEGRDEGRNRDYWRENERQGMSDRGDYGSVASGEYYGERSRDYGGEGYAGDRYRGQGYGSQQGSGGWEQRQGYGSQSGRDWEQGRDAEQERDWRSRYGSASGRDY